MTKKINSLFIFLDKSQRRLSLSILPLILCLSVTSVSLWSTGCASPGKKTAIGAGAGAGTGAVIGGLTGGWKGAAVGAAIGGVTGGAIGNVLDRQAQELSQVAETKRTKDGILVKLKSDLLFASGSAILKDQAVSDLTELGNILAKYPQDRIKVEGFTDNTGSATFNEELSKRRAEAVRDVLRGRGVKDNQMSVVAFGPSRPIANNSTKEGRSQNRRVELHIDVPEQAG